MKKVVIFGCKREYPFKLYLICTLLSQSFSIATPQALSCFNNSLPYRVQNTRLMSHHAPCGNLLMLLTCLSHSPSRCLSSSTPLTSHSSDSLLTLPRRWNERRILLSQYSRSTWGTESGCLRAEVISVGRMLTVPLSLWCWSFCAPQTHSVPTRPACFR